MFANLKKHLFPITLSKAAVTAVTNPDTDKLEVADATLSRYSQTTNWLLDELGDIPFRDITPKMIADWQDVVANRVGPVTQNLHASTLHAIGNRLVALGHVAENPARFVRFVPEPPLNPKAITEENYRRMRAVADVRDRAMVDVLWDTGCRRGGLCSMTLRNLDFWRDEVKTKKGRTKRKWRVAIQVIEKGEKPRFVYGGDETVESLMRWLDKRPKVETTAVWVGVRGVPLEPNGITQALLSLKRRAGIPDNEPAFAHSYRHAFCIRKLEEGHDLALVSAWMGHSSPSFTAERYCIRSEAQLRKAYFAERPK